MEAVAEAAAARLGDWAPLHSAAAAAAVGLLLLAQREALQLCVDRLLQAHAAVLLLKGGQLPPEIALGVAGLGRELACGVGGGGRYNGSAAY
jgi:hypothetical protein